MIARILQNFGYFDEILCGTRGFAEDCRMAKSFRLLCINE